jgi:hypothetical protein
MLVFSLAREYNRQKYLCKWQVDAPPPPNIYDALKAIKDSRK